MQKKFQAAVLVTFFLMGCITQKEKSPEENSSVPYYNIEDHTMRSG